MAQILKGSHTPRSSGNGMNHTFLCRSWYSFIDPGGMEGVDFF